MMSFVQDQITVALACDIEEMYLKVQIQEKDRSYFRILWRDLYSSCHPDVYEFSLVVFGKNSAPMETPSLLFKRMLTDWDDVIHRM